MSDPVFGISLTRSDNEPRSAILSNMSIVGLVFTAPDADTDAFPLDEPVLFSSDDSALLALMGDSGTGPAAVRLIDQQLGEFQAAATIVGVRVTEGATADETIANLRGSMSSRSGMFALLDAPSLLGVTPRLISIPGFTAAPTNSIGAVAITTAGADYVVGDAITATGGGGSGFAGSVASVNASGGITGVTITSSGIGYTSAPTLAVASDAGAGGDLSATIDAGSNAIVADLPSLLDRLLAVAVVSGPTADQVSAVAWRQAIQSERIIGISVGAKVAENNTVVVVDAAPAVIGIGIRRDHEFGGRPFHSWANQPIRGIVGPSRPIDFSILDGATEGQQLLAANLGVIVRGENSDGAIADGGFVFIGTDSCSDDPLWRFYNQVRGRDFIHLMFIKTLRIFIGRRNIDIGTVEDILATMKAALRDIQASGDLLGFRVGFSGAGNSPEQLRLGRFNVAFQAEEPPVLRHLGIQSARYRPALDALLSDLLTSLDAGA